MSKILSNLRPINLLLVALSQLVFYFMIIVPTVNQYLRLNSGLIYAFILCTVLITSAGYHINDFFDFENDRLNQKKNYNSDKNSILTLFYIKTLMGFFIALYIAYILGDLWLSLIYILAALLLFLYSSHLKSTILLGNILVSGFSAMVFLILIVAEWPALKMIWLSNPDDFSEVISLIAFFGLFAFTISMVREIVKDIEDLDGDKIAGIKTLPVVWGIERAKIIAAFFGITLLIVLMAWFYSTRGFNGEVYFVVVFLLSLFLPTIYLIYKCLFAKEIKSFRFISQLSKIIMFLGLFFLILYSWN